MRQAALAGARDFDRYARGQTTQGGRSNSYRPAVELSPRVLRMVRLAIASSRAVLLVGPPGTGKTAILEQIISEFDQDPQRYGFTRNDVTALSVTPEEEWTFDTIVLGETLGEGGELKSTEGYLLQAISADKWLVLDEANRADMDRVLGGALTWLSDVGMKVKIGQWKESGKDDLPVYLGWSDDATSDVVEGTPPSREYLAGRDWRLLGTYNAVDAQRVFRMGQALSRRFKHVPIPPASRSQFFEMIDGWISDDGYRVLLQDRVTKMYAAHLDVEEAKLGPGLFVDIPRYVEYGLRFPDDENKDEELAEAGGDGGDLAGSSSEDNGGVDSEAERPAVQPENDDTGHDAVAPGAEGMEDMGPGGQASSSNFETLIDQLLAEAYLASVGSLLAKFDSEVMDDLRLQMMVKEAFSETSWKWIVGSLSVMRS
jgi:hypothetical protein